MKMTKRQQWMLFAGAAVAVASPLAERAIAAAWRAAAGEEPPDEASGRKTDWGKVVAWTITSAIFVGLAQVGVRQLAAATWEGLRGEAPPKKRPKRRRRRRALA
jgi:hypothetical protein